MGYTVLLLDHDDNVLELSCDVSNQGTVTDMLHPFRTEMEVTFNLRPFFVEALGGNGLKDLYGEKACECLPKLVSAVLMLGTNTTGDLWESTAGNAGNALNELLQWCRELPHGVFKVY